MGSFIYLVSGVCRICCCEMFDKSKYRVGYTFTSTRKKTSIFIIIHYLTIESCVFLGIWLFNFSKMQSLDCRMYFGFHIDHVDNRQNKIQ